MKHNELSLQMYQRLTVEMLKVCQENKEMTTAATINAVATLLGSIIITAPTKKIALETFGESIKFIEQYINNNYDILHNLK